MAETFQDVINSKTPILVDFYATWCGPCKAMHPILEEVKEKLGEDVRIIKIDIDKNNALAQAYNIRSVPTLILFKHGRNLWQHSGVISGSQLTQIINSNK